MSESPEQQDQPAPTPQFSLWATEGSLLGADQDGNPVAMAVRKNQRVDVDENGAERGLVKWVKYKRDLTGTVNMTVATIMGDPTSVPDVKLATEEFLLLVRHKTIHIVAGDQARTVTLKPGSTLTKNDIAELMNFGKNENFTIQNTGLSLPVHYDSIPADTAVRISILPKTILVDRDPVLFEVEGPRVVSLQINRSHTVKEAMKEIAVLIPGPLFDLYTKNWTKIQDFNFKNLADGSRIRHVCHPKIIKIPQGDKVTEIAIDTKKTLKQTVAFITTTLKLPDTNWLLRDKERKEMMPSWKSVDHNATYNLIPTDKSLSITGFSERMEDVKVGTMSEPVYDVEAAFNIQNQFFSFGKRKDPKEGEDFCLELRPLTITIVSFAETSEVTISQEDCTEQIRNHVNALTELTSGDWDLCYSASSPPLSSPYSYSQFTRSAKKYHVVCKAKQISVRFNRITTVSIPVGVRHNEMLKQLKRDFQISAAVDVVSLPEREPADISWVKAKSGMEIELVERVKYVTVQKEELWPHEISGGANEATVELTNGQTAEATWKTIVNIFDLQTISNELHVNVSSLYLTSTSSDEPVTNLAYATMRHDSVLVLCLPRKKIIVSSAIHSDLDGGIVVNPGDTHDTVLKKIETTFGADRKRYRLLGPYPAKQEEARKTDSLTPNSLAYLALPENAFSYFLLCPPKMISVLSSEDDDIDTVWVSFATTYSEVLVAIAKAFGVAKTPTYLETEDGARVDSITYHTVNPLVVYTAHWTREKKA
eukprot:TRINITY_DN20194_c0_g1_i1.p1 TRINITY_DN20194_c0_g1~~TRINITY_DN20194_c0_g1_i1.p1  ORF type:complete len:764 (+),score=150.94 TRINITY_DN20194_c0_g1_i1:57-2348(+)